MLEELLEQAHAACSSLIGFKPEKSQLKYYDQKHWDKFCVLNKFEMSAGGLFIPQSLTAYVNISSPVFVSNIFHELFGHGTFCEHSSYGINFSTIESESQLQYLTNPSCTETFCKQYFPNNLAAYEGFALWLESRLCAFIGFSEVWDLKRTRIPDSYNSLFDYTRKLYESCRFEDFLKMFGFSGGVSSLEISHQKQAYFIALFQEIH